MKMNKVLPLTLATAVAMTLAACNLKAVTSTVNKEGTVESTVKPNIGKAGAPGSVATNPNIAGVKFARPNATVKGQLLDTDGKPIADAVVLTGNGQVTKTDAQGNYSIGVTAEDGKEVVLVYQKNGYVFSSQRVTMGTGQTAIVNADIKKLDSNVVSVKAADGGTFANSTGVLEVDVPKGALTGDAQMTLTPLSFGANGTANELPGSLETVDENGDRLLLMPAEYWSVDLSGATIKEGESITMRMKLPSNDVAPVPLKAGDTIPCYIYDAKLGYWNSPNLGPIVEKDGALWATYEIKASALTSRTDVLPRSVQDIYYGSANSPLSDDQLMANARDNASGGNSFGIATQGGGAIGGHTYYNLFGTKMTGRVVDENGNALNGATVSIRGTSVDANMTSGADGTPGHYGSLQYRGQSANVSATLNQYCKTSASWATAAHNWGPFTNNQFGLKANGQMEQKDPVSQGWPDLKVDTRHPLNLTFSGGTASKVQAGSLTYKVNGSAITYAELGTKHFSRGVKYTLEATGTLDQGAGTTTFTIPSTYTYGAPFTVNLDMNMSADGIK